MKSYNRTTASLLDEAVSTPSVQTNPDYKTRIKQGVPLAALPYSLRKDYSVAKAVHSYAQYFERGRRTSVQDLGESVYYIRDNLTAYQALQIDLTAQMNAFLNHKSNKLLSKIKAQSLPLLMLYKERHKTGALVLGFLQKALDFAKFAKRRQWKKALGVYGWGSSRSASLYYSKMKKWGDRTNTVGDAWLQARFAWIPLYHDIVDSLNSAAEYEKKIHTHRVKVGDEFERTSEYYSDPDAEHPWKGTRKGWSGMYVNYSITDETLAAVGSMMDIPTTLWDVVPWSFVVDRIVNISQYLDLQNATLGTAFSSGCSTLFYVDTINHPPAGIVSYYPSKLTYLLADYGRYYYTTGDPPTRTNVRMTRTVLTEFPKPKLEYPLANSFVQGVDLFFLAAQVKRRFASRL